MPGLDSREITKQVNLTIFPVWKGCQTLVNAPILEHIFMTLLIHALIDISKSDWLYATTRLIVGNDLHLEWPFENQNRL